MQPGALVVFEGPEGVGKTTQLNRLARAIQSAGIQFTILREPGGTAVGEAVRRVLLDPSLTPSGTAEALLFLASRAQLVSGEVRPALARGEIVLLDRFFLSTYAYQVHGRGLDEEDVVAANRLAIGGLVPDLTIVLQLDVNSGLVRAAARGERDRMELADVNFHERVGAAFSLFASGVWQAAHAQCGRIVAIDAGGTEDEVFNRVLGATARNVARLEALRANVGEAVIA